ncbi:MAG: dienelactone hydrolase family protein [Chitinophagaceae bacterium]|nr:dienelactone hydrolase family protein [Chitinophagaceae bacterium]
MKIQIRVATGLMAALFLAITACNNGQQAAKTETTETAAASYKEENITYGADSIQLKGFIAYSDSSDYKRPGILVVPEWWGVTDYTRKRARRLAELGYVALVVDMYGEGKTADNPQDAGTLAEPFYTNLVLTKSRVDAALAKLKTYPQVDTANIAAIGYCFGGSVALNVAKLGEDLKGIVVFHGNLAGAAPDAKLLKAKVLVCHGAVDPFVKPEEVTTFKKQMDSIGANYTFKAYPDAVHAFTNPDATEKGKKFNIPIAYNQQADSTSWIDMQQFFGTIFPAR